MQQGGSPKTKAIVAQRGLRQVADEGALERVVDPIIAGHAGEVPRFHAGNSKRIGLFVGQVMKAPAARRAPTWSLRCCPGSWRKSPTHALFRFPPDAGCARVLRSALSHSRHLTT
ncbi:hypothetical protein [Sorangium sp. So ce426]|uniref:hypothetical protein n=1 Tax=unclassified Sorangium TaxID=2621164 RepID=UPI003F5CA11E